MRYHEPYGGAADAPYVNGDPSLGRAGSIPPAEAIEYPQRELANFINDSSIVPSDTDLHQVARSIQNGSVNYKVDTGTTNAYNVTLTPAPLAYKEGMVVRFKALNAPTGTSTLNVNALGAKPLVKRGGANLSANDFAAGDMLEALYTGTAFQLIGIQPIPMLWVSAVYYVATTGNDANDGLTAITPFLTLQRAINVANSFNMNGFTTTINIAPGTYATSVSTIGTPINGSGGINIIGVHLTPTAVILSCSVGSALIVSGTPYFVDGLTFRCTGANAGGGDPGFGLYSSAGYVAVGNCAFDACTASHFCASAKATISISGPINIVGVSAAHETCDAGSIIIHNPVTPPLLTITGVLNFSNCFWGAARGSLIANRYGTITGTATGVRYIVASNSVADTGGAGASYLPGNSAGSTSTGGQYV